MAEDYYDDEGHTREEPCFALIPLNSAARKAVEHVRNKYFQYQPDNNTFGLWIDLSDPTRRSCTLGRGDSTNIYLPESVGKGNGQISSTHASFDVVEATGAVLLWDHSRHRTTEPFSGSHGHTFTVKHRSNSTSVLVAQGINTRVAFGRDRYYQFELQWRSDGLYDFGHKDEPYVMGPRNARTKKYLQGKKVGGGAYGNVWQVLDVTTGSLMAVKKFHNLSGKNLEFATREVANLFKINKDTSIRHEHILEIFDYAGGGENDNWGEIFMPLMAGNLKTLVEKTEDIDPWTIGDLVLRQMLLALQCIASHKIVHRDIKPENILWDYDPNGDYHFCLGDFGLSNDPKLARTVAGTEPFMAPEVYHRREQSTKVDIWSLFATVVWVRNTQEFRGICGQMGAQQIHGWLVEIAREPGYESIRTMASLNPRKRPSAKDQLGILDSGGYDPSYDNVGSGDELSNDLGKQFQGMNLQDDQAEYGQDAGPAMGTSPELPYYEPYTTGLMDPYYHPWKPEAGPSKKYMPGLDAPRAGNEEDAWAYGQYDQTIGAGAGGGGEGSGEGTTVPEMWTARPLELLPEEEHTQKQHRRKQKGKYKH